MADDDLRTQLGKLVRQLVNEGDEVEEQRSAVTDTDMTTVLDELLAETAALTRVLLGGERSAGASTPHPHAWLQTTAEPE